MQGFRELVRLHLEIMVEREACREQDRHRAELAVLDEQLAGVRETLEKAETVLTTLKTERRRVEGEITGLSDSQTKYREQLMQAKTNEVYRTLLSEIETAQKTVSDKETTVLEFMEKIDAAEAVAAEARQELKGEESENSGTAKKLRADIDTLEQTRNAALAKAEVARADVPRRLLSVSDRVAAAREGRAMTLVVDRSCTECHVAIRPQVWLELLREDEIKYCGGCGRIVFRQESVDRAAGNAEAPAGTATPDVAPESGPSDESDESVDAEAAEGGTSAAPAGAGG
jgi:predicted  nucleic acid-binding Zn-ribbon protein